MAENQESQEVKLVKTERPNSINFRYGGAGTDVKLYFDDANDLDNQIKRLSEKSTEISKGINEIKKELSSITKNMG